MNNIVIDNLYSSRDKNTEMILRHILCALLIILLMSSKDIELNKILKK